jgi:hypothetical protein
LRENHEKAYRSPDFLRRSTGREQLCATFFTESRMEFRGSTNLYRKSGFGLHQLRNCSSLSLFGHAFPETMRRMEMFYCLSRHPRRNDSSVRYIQQGIPASKEKIAASQPNAAVAGSYTQKKRKLVKLFVSASDRMHDCLGRWYPLTAML